MRQVDVVRDFMTQAGQDTPVCVTEPTEDDRLLRARLILEEALETIREGLGVSVTCEVQPYEVSEDFPFINILDSQDFSLAISQDFSIIKTVDGAEDLRWVGVEGIYAMCGVDPEPPRQEVNRSNMSKFIDGHRREDGKWIKGPSYSPADLSDKIRNVI